MTSTMPVRTSTVGLFVFLEYGQLFAGGSAGKTSPVHQDLYL